MHRKYGIWVRRHFLLTSISLASGDGTGVGVSTVVEHEAVVDFRLFSM